LLFSCLATSNMLKELLCMCECHFSRIDFVKERFVLVLGSRKCSMLHNLTQREIVLLMNELFRKDRFVPGVFQGPVRHFAAAPSSRRGVNFCFFCQGSHCLRNGGSRPDAAVEDLSRLDTVT
jgi:hypothetical protein